MTAIEAPTASLREVAELSHAWPFEEARKIVARLKRKPKDEVIFETGYGPSGLPHIGTFGEVARTSMVRHAFRVLTEDKIKTRLIAFSDDMDGLRKVPDNIPNKELVAQHLGKPLTRVPDPFGTHDSFAAHNNARLRAFLDQFGFDYEFMSSTACYTSGRFDDALLKVLHHFEQVMEVMLPSLREERAQTYSPFLPIDPESGIVLQVPVVEHDAKAGTITYEHPDRGERVTTRVTGGRCKLQWKPDCARRRLRNGRQGSDRFGEAFGRNLSHARRGAAGRLQLRAVSRRKRTEDFKVERQWPDHRRMAALCQPRESVAVHVS
jgi:lysyl-tRNA synthetase class 1